MELTRADRTHLLGKEGGKEAAPEEKKKDLVAYSLSLSRAAVDSQDSM